MTHYINKWLWLFLYFLLLPTFVGVIIFFWFFEVKDYAL